MHSFVDGCPRGTELHSNKPRSKLNPTVTRNVSLQLIALIKWIHSLTRLPKPVGKETLRFTSSKNFISLSFCYKSSSGGDLKLNCSL